MTKTNFALSLSSPDPTTKKIGIAWRLVGGGSAALGIAAGLLVAAHEVSGFGPWAADTLREVIGVSGVARLEDAAYSVKDTIHQFTRRGDAPKTYWEVPTKPTLTPPALLPAALTSTFQEESPALESWSPDPTALLFPKVAAKGDGVWVPMDDVGDGTEMKKTLLHPDPERTWTELFVVAIDMEAASLRWVPGSVEPLNVADGAADLKRPARIPNEAHGALLAAFNGGFKTQHGKFGARSDNVTLVPPRPHQCTLGQTESGALVLGTYEDLTNQEELTWFRQTPGCMVENGRIHSQLVNDANTNWGATLDGGTVIRRSAIGLSEDERTLYVGISNDTTARALALGMQAAGAHTVAQLDVNYAYPKFVTYEENAEGLSPRSLAPGFVIHDAQYLKGEARDFFYLARK